MLRSSAAAASRAFRLIAASSRPSILLYTRPITTIPINPIRQFLFLDPKSQFQADQSRGYARGRGAAAGSSDEDEDDDEDEDLEGIDSDDDSDVDFSEDDDDDDSDESD